MKKNRTTACDYVNCHRIVVCSRYRCAADWYKMAAWQLMTWLLHSGENVMTLQCAFIANYAPHVRPKITAKGN